MQKIFTTCEFCKDDDTVEFSIRCLREICNYEYKNLQYYFDKICNYTYMCSQNKESENIAMSAFEFWTTLIEIEIDKNNN